MKFLPALACLFAASLVASAAAEAGMTKITDGIHAYVGATDDRASNSYGANAGFVVGDDHVLVVDTLISAKKAEAMIAEIRKVTDKPITYVLNTHFHTDHCFGNSAFAKIGSTIISHPMAKAYQAKYSKMVLDKADLYMGLSKEEMAGTEVVLPHITFTDRMEIDLGGLAVELIFVTHSHSRGSVMAYVPARKTLFAGDVLWTDYYPNVKSGDVEGWQETLDVVLGLDVDKIVPGHGPLSDKSDAEELKAFLAVFDEKAKAAAQKSSDIAEVAAMLEASLPKRPHGKRMINSSLKWKYMRKKKK